MSPRTQKILIKICGITRPEDAREAERLGVDFIGINLWPRSKRYLPLKKIPSILSVLQGKARVVFLLVDPARSEIEQLFECGLLPGPGHTLQVHGRCEPEFIRQMQGRGLSWLVPFSAGPKLSAEQVNSVPADWVLLDTPAGAQVGGTGEPFDWASMIPLRRKIERPLFLAGGLHAENVATAYALLAPEGLDVASGVESSPGIKDHHKMAKFIEVIRSR